MMTDEMPAQAKISPQWWFEQVSTDDDGMRLDRFLRRLVSGLPQKDIERMLRSGLIRLDGVKAKPANRLSSGQMVRLPPHLRDGKAAAPTSSTSQKKVAPRATTSLRRDFESMVIAEGSDWVALNKPSGLAVQGGSKTHSHVDGMLMALANGDDDARLRLVHRIDKDTSGLLLLAKNRTAARRLTDDFRKHRMQKTYLALVLGVPPQSMQIRHPLAKQAGRSGERMIVAADGQPAHTEAIRLDVMGRQMALMALRPLTGRTHQLRVHLAHEGHPIAGDGKYGGQEAHKGGLVARRLHLHAWRLRLGDGTLVEAPLGGHMKGCLHDLGFAVPSGDWPFDRE